MNSLKCNPTRAGLGIVGKSIVKFGYRGERLIEPSSSWFTPKFPLLLGGKQRKLA